MTFENIMEYNTKAINDGRMLSNSCKVQTHQNIHKVQMIKFIKGHTIFNLHIRT